MFFTDKDKEKMGEGLSIFPEKKVPFVVKVIILAIVGTVGILFLLSLALQGLVTF